MTAKRDTGFTLIELLIVVAIISMIAAVAVPQLMRMRMGGQETSAMLSLKTVNASEVAYSASCGNSGFATLFATLAAPAPTIGFISADLSTDPSIKSGYSLALAPGLGAVAGPPDCNGTATSTNYYATAVPTAYGSTGSRSFATNANNTIYQEWAATAPVEPFGPPATPIQ